MNNDGKQVWQVLFLFAGIKFAVHLLANALGGYGYFRDEFYYIACSEHLALGYVDHPPLSIFILAVSRALLGDSIIALRFLPAVAAAATVYLSGLMTRELGGGIRAIVLACTAALIAPVHLGISSFYSMNSFDLFFWSLALYIVIVMIKRDDPKMWLSFGLVAGLGLQNKISMAFLCFGILVGLLLTEHRRWLVTKWLWLGVMIAALLFLPHIIWQVGNDWPTLEFMHNATTMKNAPITAAEFLLGQVMELHPLNFLVWFPGLLMLFFHREMKKWRIIGWAYLAILVLFIVQQAKVYYLSPIYPALFAAGAVGIEMFSSRQGRRWVQPALVGLLATGGILVAPLALPILPVETYISYAQALGQTPKAAERQELGKLPQHFADRFGWEEKVAAVARAYNRLTPEERAHCTIYTDNYGRCGAIDFLGKKYGIPRAISGHNNYWLWGPADSTVNVVIILGGDREDHEQVFDEVIETEVVTNEYCLPYENNLSVFICRGMKGSLHEVWPRVKKFI
ncbi:MAG: ArnT family glycosyltransferase [Bacteroidota bacterium]